MNKKAWFFAILLPVCLLLSTNTMANLILADGGASGSWFNPDRDGEGLFVEVVTMGDGSQVVSVSWYTYDELGAQMWLSGSGAIGETATSISVPVIVTSGPIFGPEYNKDDLNSESWGTIELQFQTCDQGNMTYTSSIGFGSGSIPLTRITNLTQVNCVEPPVETAPVTPGKWVGVGVCFNVAADGLSVTSEGSTCTGGHAFTATLPGTKVGGGQNCTVNVICPDTYAIYPTDQEEPTPAFDCHFLGAAASGGFYENDVGPVVNGRLYERSGGDGCVGIFVATPEG